jgi:Zn-dependent protease with chaperone function
LFRPTVHFAIRFACLLVLVGIGCAHTPGASSRETWVARFGGLDRTQPQQRLEAARDRLLPDPLRSDITVAVLRSNEPGAFSWHDGSVFATRGLLRVLDDDELAAALAHEVGHILRDRGRGSAGRVLSLRGQSDAAAAAEFEADAAGMSLIKQAGIPNGSMASMLLKVRDAATLTPRCRADMTCRVLRLTQEQPSRHAGPKTEAVRPSP